MKVVVKFHQNCVCSSRGKSKYLLQVGGVERSNLDPFWYDPWDLLKPRLILIPWTNFFLFCIPCRGSYESEHTTHNKGIRRQGVGEGRTKQWGNRDIRRSVEGRGMGWGTQGIQDGYCRDFQEGRQGIWRRWVWGGLMGGEKIEVLDGGR